MQNKFTINLTGSPIGEGITIVAEYFNTDAEYVINQLKELVILINKK